MRYDLLAEARLFHFGYPPLMKRMYEARGHELREIFRRAKGTGVTTSLDMALPDPSSPAGGSRRPRAGPARRSRVGWLRIQNSDLHLDRSPSFVINSCGINLRQELGRKETHTMLIQVTLLVRDQVACVRLLIEG